MENSNTSDFKTPANNGRGTPPLPPGRLPFNIAQSYTNFPTVGQPESAKHVGFHHRCPSESILLDGQPSWLDDLLNEPDIETETPVHKGHRRSASDSYAYLESSFKAFENLAKVETRPTFLEEKFNKGLNVGGCRSVEGKDKEDCSSQCSIEGSSQAKPFTSKSDAKRAKQQSAHRSRVRKLEYIDQLERTLQLLQVGGSEIAAELEFVDQHNLILSMKNRSLKQRMDNLSQEQLIKQMEHDMLEKELGRLQAVYQMQMQRQQQMQMQMQMQHQQINPKIRRNRNKESNCIRPAMMNMNGPVHYE